MAVLRLGAFFFVATGLFGERWVGVLGDAKCWAAMERDVGPTDSLVNVDRDRGEESPVLLSEREDEVIRPGIAKQRQLRTGCRRLYASVRSDSQSWQEVGIQG